MPPEIIEPLKIIPNSYSVEKYDILCEPHFRIKKNSWFKKASMEINYRYFFKYMHGRNYQLFLWLFYKSY